MPIPPQYTGFQLKPLGSDGLETSTPADLLQDGQSPAAENVDFDRMGVSEVRGAVKIGNRPMPKSAIKTTVSRSPLKVTAGVSVPVRGYAVFPYAEDIDLGGDFNTDGVAAPSEAFHLRRGKKAAWSLKVSFQVPEEEKLYAQDTRGSGAPAVGAEAAGFDFGSWAYDEGFEDTTIIWQKGGDRVTPMSMFIGIVNVGTKLYRELTDPAVPGLNIEERSNYVVVFGWLDSPQWGASASEFMRYKVGTGGTLVGSTGSVCTKAYRIIATRHFVEPGHDYHLQVSLKLDTGTPGAQVDADDPTAAWEEDGEFRVAMSETVFDNELNPIGDHEQSATDLATDFFVLKGPLDSIAYLLRYGVRFSGRDATFLGLGMRNIPRQANGFIPTGNDAAALEKGGHRMIDCSSVDPLADLGVNLGCSHTLTADTFVSVSHEAMTGAGGPAMTFAGAYSGPSAAIWPGLGGAAHNPDALRGYYLVLGSAAPANLRGARVRLGAYAAGPPFQFAWLDHAGTPATWTDEPCFLQCLRWNQRPLVLDELRIYATDRPTDATALGLGVQRRFDLAGEAELDDSGHSEIAQLVAHWPLDDGEGGTLRETVAARQGALAPFSGAVSDTGQRGKNMLFLSGEGEALTIDLSENPVFLREFQSMLQSGRGGFAVQTSMILTESVYDDYAIVGADAVGQYGPHLISWETRGENAEGLTVAAKPLLRFTQKVYGPTGNYITAFNRPIGFALEVAGGDDQVGAVVDLPVPALDGGTPNWDVTAPWVGRHITIQVGVYADPDNAGQFIRYVSVYPKSAFLPEDEDPDQIEMAYFDSAAIQAKDIVRSVITIGGSFETEGAPYSTLSARMWVDEAHVFAAPAPGNLSAASGSGIVLRDGKIVGANSFPLRALSGPDLELDVGPGVRSGNVVQGSQVITAASALRFFDGDAGESMDALVDTYLVVKGDTHEKRAVEAIPETLKELYRVDAQAVDRSTLTLATPYNGETRDNAGMRSTRHCAYTAFDDLKVDQFLTLGRGKAYVPGTTTSGDVTLTGRLVANLAAFGGDWVLRIYSPLASSSAFDVVPSWVRGLKIPRHNRISCMRGLESRRFAGASSSFCEVDGRWRDDTPRPEGRHSLRFRGGRSSEIAVQDRLEGDSLIFPTQGDMLMLQNPPAAAYMRTSTDVLGFGNVGAGEVGRARYTEFWVKLDEIGKFQTVLWCGSMVDNPENLPGETFYEHKVNRIIRFADGRPEYVLPSAASAAGGRPDKGLFVGTADATLRSGEWTHIRWQIGELTDADPPGNWHILRPRCWVNGKEVTVRVNVAQTGNIDPRWFQTANLIESELATAALVFGASRDSYLEEQENGAFVVDVVAGLSVLPGRRVGWMHALAGQLVGFAEGTSTLTDVNSFANFEPKLFATAAEMDTAYTAVASHTTILFMALNEGAGHRPKIETHNLTTLVSSWAVLRSHPFLSLAHDLGDHGKPFTMATWANQVYAANGGRPAYYDTVRRITRHVGLLPPTNKPKFDVIRKPLWKQNYQSLGDILNDPFPVGGSDDDTDLAPNHYSNNGNNYLQQPFDEEMRWERDDSEVAGVKNDIFAFKCMFMLRDVAGRIVIYEQRESLASGSIFIEVRDGKLVIGWYDTYDKAEATLSTSTAVVKAGRWYYLYFRKRWPEPSSNNWSNPLYADPDGLPSRLIKDSLVLRQFPTGDANGDGTGVVLNETTYDVKADATGTPGYPAFTRHCISFTTLDSSTTDPLLTVSGRVTDHTFEATVAASGSTATFTVTGGALHADMWGMLLTYVSDTTVQVVGRITVVAPGLGGSITSLDGSTLLDATAQPAAICFGFKLVPNATFENSHQPDEGTFPIRLFGSPLALQASNGIAPFNGEFGSFGYCSIREDQTTPGHPGDNPEIFHNASSLVDVLEIGTDKFDNHIFRATAPDDLVFTVTGQNFTVIQSTQPNEDREVEQEGASNSVNAESLFWKYNQEVQLLDGSRRIFVTFYDPKTGDESGPSPLLDIHPSSEDFSNPSGDARFLLTELPVSRDGSGLWRRIYMTLIDGQVPQLVQTIEDNSSSSTSLVKSEGQISRGRVLELFNRPPVRAGIVTVSQRRMFYAQLPGEPGTLVWSEAYRPRVVPLNNLGLFATGDGADISGLADLNGRMMIFKEHGFVAETLVSEGSSSDRVYPTDAGCSAHNTIQPFRDRIVWRDSAGLWSMNAGGRPEAMSDGIRDFMLDDEDSRFLGFSTAAVNSHRRQYVVTAQRKGVFDPQVRIASGIGRNGPVMALYRSPALVSLAAVKGPAGGPRVLVGGDVFGFAYELDRPGSNSIGIGPQDGYAAGGQVVSVASGFSATQNAPIKVEVKATFGHDEELCGPRGVEMRWLVGSVEKRAIALFMADSGAGDLWLMPDRTIPAADLPAAEALIHLGTPSFFWESKWLDFGSPTQSKKLHFIDVYWEPGATGSVTLSLYRDFSSTAFLTKVLDVSASDGMTRVPMERGDVKLLKARIERVAVAALGTSDPGDYDTGAVFTSIVFRSQTQDLH